MTNVTLPREVVEEVREALDVLRGFGCPTCNGDCGSANPSPIFCPMMQAGAALAKLKDALDAKLPE